MHSEMNVLSAPVTDVEKQSDSALLEFKNVSFRYVEGKDVLRNVNLTLESGRLALVGPTGGGRRRPHSLMARLYDPSEGVIYLNGRDIRTFDAIERTKKDRFHFARTDPLSGTVRDNIFVRQ